MRVVEYSMFERVGSSEAIQVDVRLVAATSLDLRELVQQGRFKADLFNNAARPNCSASAITNSAAFIENTKSAWRTSVHSENFCL
jgi:sigma54-dependent transcription regulator